MAGVLEKRPGPSKGPAHGGITQLHGGSAYGVLERAGRGFPPATDTDAARKAGQLNLLGEVIADHQGTDVTGPPVIQGAAASPENISPQAMGGRR